jgi:hypothetical protein
MNPYYETVTRDFSSVHNKAAHAEWFENSEPGEEPTGTRITSVQRADLIVKMFITMLRLDVMLNAQFQWKAGTPLPGRKRKRQPLQDND